MSSPLLLSPSPFPFPFCSPLLLSPSTPSTLPFSSCPLSPFPFFSPSSPLPFPFPFPFSPFLLSLLSLSPLPSLPFSFPFPIRGSVSLPSVGEKRTRNKREMVGGSTWEHRGGDEGWTRYVQRPSRRDGMTRVPIATRNGPARVRKKERNVGSTRPHKTGRKTETRRRRRKRRRKASRLGHETTETRKKRSLPPPPKKHLGRRDAVGRRPSQRG